MFKLLKSQVVIASMTLASVGHAGALDGVSGAVEGASGVVNSAVNSASTAANNTSANAQVNAQANVAHIGTIETCTEASLNSDTEGCGGTSISAMSALQTFGANEKQILRKLQGLPVKGARGGDIGWIRQVAFQGERIHWIEIEVAVGGIARMYNAIEKIEKDAAVLRVSAPAVQARMNGDFTRLRVSCSDTDQTSAVAWNSCSLS